MAKYLKALQNAYKSSIPLLDYLSDESKKSYIKFKNEYEKAETISMNFSESYQNQEEMEKLINDYKMKRSFLDEIQRLNIEISEMEKLVNQKDMEEMLRVLTALGYLDEDGIVTLKGRVASRITAGNELIFTELLFSGLFDTLDPPHLASLLSSFVAGPDSIGFSSDEQSKEGKQSKKNNRKSAIEIPNELKVSWAALEREIMHIATVSENEGHQIDVERLKNSFSPLYLELLIQWANKVSFAKIMEDHSELDEGTIVRTIKRLDELLLQGAEAAQVISNKGLEEKFNSASASIRRGIVFSASLFAYKDE